MDGSQDTTSGRYRIIAPLILLLGLFALALAVALAPNAISGSRADAIPMLPQPGQESVPVQVSLPDEYRLADSWDDLGIRVVSAEAIDVDRFMQLYADSGRPLSASQKRVLTTGSDDPILIDFENARFLLNFFWALGLVNENPILTDGPLMQAAEGNIGRFASTGGWTLGRRPAAELYASVPLITLTAAQQARLEEVTANVYRPCCNNHTAFADCNHGMAMLGLLELLASQDASTEQMFAAAKAVNGFWFPQQALETALFFQRAMNMGYANVDPRVAVAAEVFSGTGFQQVHQWLADNNLLEQPQNGSSSCAA